MKKFIKMLYLANKYDKNISLRKKAFIEDRYYVGYKSEHICFGYCIFVFYYDKSSDNIFIYKNKYFYHNKVYKVLIKTIQDTRKEYSDSIILK